MQDGHPITFESKKICGAQLQWTIHEKRLYVDMCCLKMWQHYFGMHKTKTFMDNVSLKYFETPPKALIKQLRWHNTLALLDVELIHKLGWDNVILDVMNNKKEFQVKKPLTKTQALRAIYWEENNLERRIREAYMQDLLTSRHFK